MITDFDRNLLDLSWFTCLHMCEGCYNNSHISRVERLASEIFGRSGSDGIPITPWMSAPFRLKKIQLIPGVWYTGTMIYRINMYKWYTYTVYLRITDTQVISMVSYANFAPWCPKCFGQNPCNTHRHRRRWFTAFYNKDLKMVQGLCARFSHRLYFRYARRQAVSGWGGGIEMVTPACLRSSFQLKRLARRQVCHVIMQEWYQSEMVQVSSSPSQTWSAQICALANPLPARHAALLSSMWTFTCMRVWAGEECCDVLCRCFSISKFINSWEEWSHHISDISSPSFLWIHWFIDFEIPKLSQYFGDIPQEDVGIWPEFPWIGLSKFPTWHFLGLPSTTDLFRDSVSDDLLEVFCRVQAHFMLW